MSTPAPPLPLGGRNGTMLIEEIQLTIDDQIAWEVVAPTEKGGLFVAVCAQLGLSVQARDESELTGAAKNALDVLGQDLFENHDAIPFLIEHRINFRVEMVKRVKPQTHAGFILPVPVMRAESRDGAPA